MQLKRSGLLCLVLFGIAYSHSAVASTLLEDALYIASKGKSDAQIIVSPDAGEWERKAAEDLSYYIAVMSGVHIPIINERSAIDAILQTRAPLLLIGQEALLANSELQVGLDAVLKENPYLRTDGIVLKREDNHVYMAGNNDKSHYFAVAELLRRWGCRWYMPTDFGECIPEVDKLTVEQLNYAYSSPFEIRSYWIGWNGDQTGATEFQMRNMMTDRGEMPPTGHALGQYTRGLGAGTFDFPITEPNTAEHVATQVEEKFAEGRAFSLGMEDGSYDSDYPHDRELMKLQWDKYFMRWSVTDPMLELYNNIARILQEKYPQSNSKIGFLAYANMTIPPVRNMIAERSLYCELAPIDIDPIHGMDDPESPSKQEFRTMMYQWAKVMQGRVCIYDYDQSMLVWRDIPNPSHQAFRQDVKHYRDAGILGVNTESRNAIATIFLNLYMRARLLWNPDEDVEALLTEFFPKFYGPAAEPMRQYWNAIFDVWENTIVTEHEHFIAPAIYTPPIQKFLRDKIEEAEKLMTNSLNQEKARTRNEALYLRRLEFTRISYEILNSYLTMVREAATNIDYEAAVSAGERGLEARDAMQALGGIFMSTRLEDDDAAWWPGEVKQYRELLALIDGTDGALISKLPLEWAFLRDPERKGIAQGYLFLEPDLSYWNDQGTEYDIVRRKDYPDDTWEMIRTDLYVQAQGIRHPDRQSFVGDMWYHSEINLSGKEVNNDNIHLRFPGLFNECWLYLNGEEIAYREQEALYWRNDYRFEWDVNLRDKLIPGKNTFVLRVNCEYHFGGMFRRPFLYRKNTP